MLSPTRTSTFFSFRVSKCDFSISVVHLDLEAKRNRRDLAAEDVLHGDLRVERGLGNLVDVPLEGSAGHAVAVEAELPKVVTLVDLEANEAAGRVSDVIVVVLGASLTTGSSSGEEPADQLEVGLVFLVSPSRGEAGSNATISRLPSGSELSLPARGLEELAVNETTDEPVISLVSPLNELTRVLVSGVPLLESHTLALVEVGRTELHRLVNGSAVGLLGTVHTLGQELVSREVSVERLQLQKK